MAEGGGLVVFDEAPKFDIVHRGGEGGAVLSCHA